MATHTDTTARPRTRIVDALGGLKATLGWVTGPATATDSTGGSWGELEAAWEAVTGRRLCVRGAGPASTDDEHPTDVPARLRQMAQAYRGGFSSDDPDTFASTLHSFMQMPARTRQAVAAIVGTLRPTRH